MGKLVIKPTGNANNMVPNAASLRCSFSLISGILLAQVEKVNPATKKKAPTVIR